MTSKIAKAKATREMTTATLTPTSAAAAAAASGPQVAVTTTTTAALRKIAVSLPETTIVALEDALDDARRTSGSRFSFSAAVEVAVAELVSRPDFVDVMRAHGAGQRRKL